ncbi:MAG TPA: hypothetical protein VM434_12130 [Beijerinckiaceae bacterium]|nr:hypothetical protein [Beijerinckiaceae bacterium]
MLGAERLTEIATEVARRHLGVGPRDVDRVVVEPTDFQGRDALRVTIVIAPGVEDRISGDAVIETLFQMRRRLAEAGDERPPTIQYASADEFAHHGGSEP